MLPIVALVASFVLLGSRIGFTLFPSGDNPYITLTVESSPGTATDAFAHRYEQVDEVLTTISEIKVAYYTVQRDKRTINIELYPKDERADHGGRSAFDVEKQLLGDLGFLETEGRVLQSKVQSSGPPGDKPV